MKPTSTEAAICCMIVSNPSGGMQPHGWQKRVNDLIRAQDQELTTLRAEADRSHAQAERAALLLTDAVNQLATLRASEAAALEREGDMRHALQAAMDDNPGWYDLARESRNSSLSARTKRLQAQAPTPTSDKEPK